MELQLCDAVALEPAGARVRCAIRKARRQDTPFHYWLLRNVLPPELCQSVAALPFAAPPIGETFGKRETHNSDRIFVSAVNRLGSISTRSGAPDAGRT